MSGDCDFWLRPGGFIENGYWFASFSERGQASLSAAGGSRGRVLVLIDAFKKKPEATGVHVVTVECPDCHNQVERHYDGCFASEACDCGYYDEWIN